MKISIKLTPVEYYKLGIILQPIADQTKWRVQGRTSPQKLEYLVIAEFMQTFNYNRYDFKERKKAYQFSIKLSTGLAIFGYLLKEIYVDHFMVEELSLIHKFHLELLNHGIDLAQGSCRNDSQGSGNLHKTL